MFIAIIKRLFTSLYRLKIEEDCAKIECLPDCNSVEFSFTRSEPISPNLNPMEPK